MEQFFDWPVASVALGLGIGVGVLICAFAMLGWRAPLLFKLGTRNTARRMLRAALIVFGLMLSTTVVGSAFGTGDTMAQTVRSLVAGSLGTVDEVVVLNPPRMSRTERLRALTEPGLGTLATVDLDFFPEAESARIAAMMRGSKAIAGIVPAITDQVTVVHRASQQLRSAVALLAVPAPFPSAFGPLETADGAPIALQSLEPGEVVLNAAAAESLGAAAGQPLQLLVDGNPWDTRIRAVASNGSFGGTQPLLIVPLTHYQHVVDREGQINQLLVANHGGTDSVARSEEATLDLRQVLVDRSAAQQLHDLLARPDVQHGLREAEGSLQGRQRERISALRVEAAKPEMTGRFISLISEPRTRRGLGYLARAIPNWTERRTALGWLDDLATLSVLEVKQEALDQAREYGAVVTTVFLVLGIFSIGASILLIFLIFALLAADRAPELATMRALGMRRRQIMGMFLFEGLVYNVLGAALGAAASLGSGYLVIVALARALVPFGFRLERHVEARSLVVAFAIGMLLNFATMLLAAWRVSRLEIVAAARGEAVEESRTWLLGPGALLLLAAGLVWWRWRNPAFSWEPRHPLVVPSTISLVLLGVTCSLLSLPRWRIARRGEMLAGGVTTLAGVALAGVWLRSLIRLPTSGGETLADALTIAIGGLFLIVASVWAGTRLLGPLLRSLDRGLSGVARVRAVVRVAAGYLGHQRWRTGLTVVMFGMVIFIMVASLTLIDVLLKAYADDEPPVAGYDLRADIRGSKPIGDIEAALANTQAVSRAAFGAVGSVATQEVQTVQLSLPFASWQAATLAVVDDGFLGGIQARFERRAVDYGSDAAVWGALRERPGSAVVTASLLRDSISVASSPRGNTLNSFTIWARTNEGGRPIKLTVIGVIDPRSELDAGIYTSQATAAGLGVALAEPTTHFFAVSPGVRLNDAADGLRVSFADRSLVVTDLGNALRIIRSIRLLLTRLVQSFMGLGLIAGIAALGLVGVQSVLERRQHLGTLRALGFTGRQTRWALLFESGVVAALGLALGVVLGLVVARSLVSLLAAHYSEVRYGVPWQDIGVIAAIAWLGSTISISLAAWQAGRVSPVEALRTA